MTTKRRDDHAPASTSATDRGRAFHDSEDESVVPQSTFATGLVRDQGDAASVTRWLEQVCASVERDAMPIVRAALVHETSVQAADDWLGVARTSLAHLLDTPEIDRSATAQMNRSLQEAIGKGLPSPSEEEVLQHTNELVATMVTSWLEVVRRLTRVHRAITLDEYLLPPKSLDERLFEQFMRTLDPYAVRRGDGAGVIMKALARALFARDIRVDLPYGIQLTVMARASDGSLKSVQASQSSTLARSDPSLLREK